MRSALKQKAVEDCATESHIEANGQKKVNCKDPNSVNFETFDAQRPVSVMEWTIPLIIYKKCSIQTAIGSRRKYETRIFGCLNTERYLMKRQ